MNAALSRAMLLVATCVGVCILASCARTSMPARQRGSASTHDTAVFHLVRHAEKAADPAGDPELSDAGRARAQRLAVLLQDAPPTAIYSTDYARTRQTAAPTAARYGRDVAIYDARRPVAGFAEELRRRHVDGGDVVLVVGHSNTVSSIASAICRCDVPPLREDEYDRWISISIGRDGETSLRTTRY